MLALAHRAPRATAKLTSPSPQALKALHLSHEAPAYVDPKDCDALLLGIAAHGGFVEVACRFDDPGMVAPDAVALGIRLPVKEPTAG